MNVRRVTSSLRLRALDAIDLLPGRRDPLVPGRRQNFVGDSDFRATGDEFLTHFTELGGLRPEDRVLDVGCGIGRMARPLAAFLRPPGTYDGFDIVPAGIDWCQRRYAADHPDFTFRLAEVANELYRPGAPVEARDYTFPYPDDVFDFAFATSVFTHLLEDEADRYLVEMARVTRPGGRLFLTFFILTDASRRAQAEGRSARRFTREHGAARAEAGEVAADAVAYDEAWVRERLRAHGILVREPIRHGGWAATESALSYQDVVLASVAG